MIAPGLRRDIERAIDDFMTASPRDAESLLRCIERYNLTLDDEAEREAARGKAFMAGVQAAQDTITAAIREDRDTEAIDIQTRETIHVVILDDIETFIDEAIDLAFTE